MNNIRKWLILVLVLFTSLTWAAYETEEPVDFTQQQMGGGEVAQSDNSGQWVVVNYWATWCTPCLKEIPDLSELNRERSDLTVLGLAFEDLEDSDFDGFLEDFDVSYPILKVDVYEPPEPFGAPRVLPTTIILDKEGRAVKAFLGPVTRSAIEGYIDAQ
jgi:thiol-disulfide isomerase/thioredoxin